MALSALGKRLGILHLVQDSASYSSHLAFLPITTDVPSIPPPSILHGKRNAGCAGWVEAAVTACNVGCARCVATLSACYHVSQILFFVNTISTVVRVFRKLSMRLSQRCLVRKIETVVKLRVIPRRLRSSHPAIESQRHTADQRCSAPRHQSCVCTA